MTSLTYEIKTTCVPCNVEKLAESAKQSARVWRTGIAAVITVLLPLVAAFSVARALGVSALCYDDLSAQAASAGLCALPFAAYCLVISARRSMKAILMVGTVFTTIFGLLLAAML